MQIGPKEMANAVREMLSAAGMPVDLERTGLLERSMKLQKQLEAAAAKLDNAEKVILSLPPTPFPPSSHFPQAPFRTL